MDTLAKRVKHARALRDGMRQEDLAEASGLKQGDISKIENGKIQKTTGLVVLARALNVAPHWLATGEGPMHPEGEWPGTQLTLEQIQQWPPELIKRVEEFALFELSRWQTPATTVNQTSNNVLTASATGSIKGKLPIETTQGLKSEQRLSVKGKAATSKRGH